MVLVKRFILFFILLLILAGSGAGAEEETPKKLIINEPVLITSAGQSFDVYLMKVVLNELGFDVDLQPLASKEEIKNFNQIIVVPGVSFKGLAASGISFDDELQRISGLIEAAERTSCRTTLIYIESFPHNEERTQEILELIAPWSSQIVIYEGSEGPVDYLQETAEKGEIPVFWIGDRDNLNQEFLHIMGN